MTARNDDLRRIEAEVGSLIRRVKRVMGERAREVHPDLHPMTYVILAHLADHGPMRGADLSGAFEMDKGGVSRQVQALVDLGLVERQPDPEDRRAILLPHAGVVRIKLLVARAVRQRIDADYPEPAARRVVSGARRPCRAGACRPRPARWTSAARPRAARPGPRHS